MLKIGLDFDGVIQNDIAPDSGEFGEVITGAKDAVQRFLNEDLEVVIYTAREDTDEVEQWLEKNDFPPLEVTNQKIPADIYVDDRGYKFEKWQEKTITDVMAQAKANAEKVEKAGSTKEVVKNGNDFRGYNRRFFEGIAGKGFKEDRD